MSKARIAELASQARQIIEDKKVPRSGELEYRFTDGAIRTLLINESLRRQLASGALVIARLGDHYDLLPRAAADQVHELDAGMIVLDHGQPAGAQPTSPTSQPACYNPTFKM